MEKFLPGLVPHGGTANSRTWREVCELGAELGQLAGLMGSESRNRVAIIVSWPNRWALELAGKPQTFDAMAECLACYEAFWQRGIGVDIVSPEADLSGYAAVAAPCLYQMTATQAGSLRAYVQEGGHLLTGYFSGVVDEFDRVHLGGYPALLQDVLGLAVEEWHALPEGRIFPLSDGFGQATFWAEAIHAHTAQPVATYEECPLAGRPALLKSSFGRGTAWYFGTRTDKLQDFVAQLLDAAQIAPPVSAPPGVEVVLRHGAHRKFLFLINHNEAHAAADLGPLGATSLLTGNPVHGRLRLAPAEVCILSIE